MSNEVIKFGDAEAMAIAWLTGKLGSGVLIHTKVPNPRPAKFVQVVLTGGRRIDLAYRRAQLTFKCWGATEVAASDLCDLTYAQFFAVAGETVGGVTVRRVDEVGAPANVPDPESDLPRYQFTVGAECRGTAI